MESLEEVGQDRAGDTRKNTAFALDDDRLGTQRSGRGGGFQADVAAADDSQPGAGV